MCIGRIISLAETLNIGTSRNNRDGLQKGYQCTFVDQNLPRFHSIKHSCIDVVGTHDGCINTILLQHT